MKNLTISLQRVLVQESRGKPETNPTEMPKDEQHINKGYTNWTESEDRLLNTGIRGQLIFQFNSQDPDGAKSAVPDSAPGTLFWAK